MRTVKQKKRLGVVILALAVILSIALMPKRTTASATLIEACRAEPFESAVCVAVYNGDVYRIPGCINGGLSWDESCWPFPGTPPSDQ